MHTMQTGRRFKRTILASCLLGCLLLAWCYLRGDRINRFTFFFVKEGMSYRQAELILGGPPRKTPNPLPISTFQYSGVVYSRKGFKLPDGTALRVWFSSAACIYV